MNRGNFRVVESLQQGVVRIKTSNGPSFWFFSTGWGPLFTKKQTRPFLWSAFVPGQSPTWAGAELRRRFFGECGVEGQNLDPSRSFWASVICRLTEMSQPGLSGERRVSGVPSSRSIFHFLTTRVACVSQAVSLLTHSCRCVIRSLCPTRPAEHDTRARCAFFTQARALQV